MIRPRRSTSFRTGTLFCLLALPPRAEAQTVTELYVSPDTLLLTEGERRGVTVQAFDNAGNVILAIRYRSADPAVATVGDNGTVTAVRAGRTRLTVQAGRKEATVVVVVAAGKAQAAPDTIAAKVVRLAAHPAVLALLPTERAEVAVTALGADEAPLQPVRLRWRSLRPDVVAVNDSTGVITGVATGTATVEASVANAVSVGVTVTVALAPITLDRTVVALAPGVPDTVTAAVPSQGNRALRGEDLSWLIRDPAVATVSPGGVVRGLAAGRTELVASGFLQERRVPVVVHAPVSYFLASPRVSEPARVPVGTSREFTVSPHAADSTPIEGVPISWTVADTTVAVFDTATRRLTGRGLGRTTLSFSARGFLPRAWTVEVIAATLGFERDRAVLRPGEEVTFKAGLLDESGRLVAPVDGLRWRSSDSTRATVSAAGTLVALAPGRVTVRAELGAGPAAEAVAFIVGEVLVGSNRGGVPGLYAVAFASRDTLYPVVTDSGRNVDGAYSPDRTRIAFASDRGGGHFDIWVADADGGSPVRLTTDPADERQPAWSPDGKAIVYVSARGDIGQLHVIPASGGGARPLTSLPSGAAEPAVSPDGAMVAFTTFPAGPGKPGDIATVPFGGGTPAPVTATRERGESSPVYLASGDLAWVEQPREAGQPDVIARRTTGGTPVVYARSSNQITAAASSRDGKVLGWVVGQASERDRKSVDYVLRVRAVAGGTERFVRFRPGERVLSLGF